MALQLHISGPGLDVLRLLASGDPEQVLGRDADCDICLPDPQRNVSRSHLAVWNADEVLHFRVLSVVNGVTMPFGDAPPGAKGVLLPGQAFTLAEYSIEVNLVTEERTADPWSVFDRDASGSASIPLSAASLDDPFGEWGFEAAIGSKAVGEIDVSKMDATPDLDAFFRGVGLDPATLGPLSVGEVETIGRLVRASVLGLMQLHATAKGVKQDLNAEDRTTIATTDNNPLKSDWPAQVTLHYMFGGRAAGVGFIDPERALQSLLAQLSAHESAVVTATRATLEGTLREFSPDALKSKLLGDSTSLFEGARTWDAYSKHYVQQAQAMSAWVQRLLDRYFAETYLRESLRLQREAVQRARREGDTGG